MPVSSIHPILHRLQEGARAANGRADQRERQRVAAVAECAQTAKDLAVTRIALATATEPCAQLDRQLAAARAETLHAEGVAEQRMQDMHALDAERLVRVTACPGR